MKTKKLICSSLFISIGVVTSSIFYIPIGVSKCFPVQHLINILSAVLLGPYYGILNAFLISLIRNLFGMGSLLAFPGSMFGALLSGILYKKTRNKPITLLGEIFGTGVLGGIFSYPIAKFLLGKDVAIFFFVIPFLISTLGGSLLGYFILIVLEKSGALKYFKI